MTFIYSRIARTTENTNDKRAENQRRGDCGITAVVVNSKGVSSLRSVDRGFLAQCSSKLTKIQRVNQLKVIVWIEITYGRVKRIWKKIP